MPYRLEQQQSTLQSTLQSTQYPVPGLLETRRRPRTTLGERVWWTLTVLAVVLAAWVFAAGSPVRATVLATDGAGICRMAWTVAGDARPAEAEVDCTFDATVDDVVRVQALAWPAVGEALDLWITPWALGVLVVVPLACALGLGAARRRRARAADGGRGASVRSTVAVAPDVWPAHPTAHRDAPARGAPSVRAATGGRPTLERPVDARFARPDVPDAPGEWDGEEVDVYVAVRRHPGLGDDPVGAVQAALADAGFVGGLMDGAAVDAPGWIIGVTTGFGDGTLLRWVTGAGDHDVPPDHLDGVDVDVDVDDDFGGGDDDDPRFPALSADARWDSVRHDLIGRLGTEVHIGRYVLLDTGPFPSPAGQVGLPAVDTAAHRPVSRVVVGRWPRADLPLIARGVGVPVAAVRAEGVVVLAPAAADGTGSMFAAAAWPDRSPRLLLWSVGSQHGFVVVHRSGVVLQHTWREPWALVDPSRTPPGRTPDPEIRAALSSFVVEPARADELAALFGIDDPHRIRELGALLVTDRPASAVARLLGALGLPAVAADVLDDPARTVDVPGAWVQRPVGALEGWWRALTVADWPAADGAPRRRRWWQWPAGWSPWMRAAAIAPTSGAMAGVAFAEGRPVNGWLAVGFGLASIAWELRPGRPGRLP